MLPAINVSKRRSSVKEPTVQNEDKFIEYLTNERRTALRNHNLVPKKKIGQHKSLLFTEIFLKKDNSTMSQNKKSSLKKNNSELLSGASSPESLSMHEASFTYYNSAICFTMVLITQPFL